MRAWATLWVALALTGCQPTGDVPGKGTAGASVPADFLASQETWREQRRQHLLEPDGWTSLIGLHWLELKAHYVGSSAGNGIQLAMGPPKLGMVEQQDGQVFFTPEPGVDLTFNGEALKQRTQVRSDHDTSQDVIGFDDGKGVLTVIQRGQRYALRVKHADAPTRLQFAHLDYWPADPAWKLEGRFIPNPPDKTIPIIDMVGMTTASPNPGVVEFARDGRSFRLEALAGENGGLFLILADRTSGHGSYPAGRYLDTAAPANGKVTLDFNQAYNPPCVFTPFATCPLPPPENRLDLAITAGEKAYRKAGTTP